MIACIRDAKSILISGPGEAKGELKERLRGGHRRISGKTIAPLSDDPTVTLPASGDPAHTTVPNNAPMPAVTAMASAPQNVTRIAPTATPAPPARAANPPRSTRNTSEVPETRGIRPASGLWP